MKPDFSFTFDERIRKILERDYLELQQLDVQSSPKSVIVLSGGVIEGLLLDALVACGARTFKRSGHLEGMIDEAKNRGIITEYRLTHATRNYRNLIHPAVEITKNMIFERSDAILAKSAVDIIIREVRNWALVETRTRTIKKFLGQLNQDQIQFLQLFANVNPKSHNQFQHPFLSHAVYISTRSLIENDILMRQAEDGEEYTETVRLVSCAVKPIEELVLKGKIQRDSIVLDFRNIAASGAGGSGGPRTFSHGMRQ